MDLCVGGRTNWKQLVVERDSAVLGYPGEMHSPLDADHHTICKYPSNLDSNYINVRNVIKSLVKKLTPKSELAMGLPGRTHNRATWTRYE